MKQESEIKTAIVTGSSSGLGAEISSFLVQNGFNVIINYNKKKKEAETLANELSKIGNVQVIKGDVSNFSDAKSIIQKSIKQFGQIDVLINNAGIHVDGTILKMSSKSWKKVIDTNLTGVFNMTKAVLPYMIKQKFGRIINISSFTALKGIAGTANYSTSKAGIIGFTKSLAKEIAKHNIMVNAIAPGYFDIGMFHDFDSKTREKIIKSIPSGRLGQSKEISELILVLISSNYLTGQVFVIDGGYSC